jgi:competence protein ComEA
MFINNTFSLATFPKVLLQTKDLQKKLQFEIPLFVMLRLRHWIKDFFGFPRSHINGFIILLTLTTLMLFSEPIWHWWISNNPTDPQRDRTKLDSLVALWDHENGQGDMDRPEPQKLDLFRFDPNTATAKDLLALGFTPNLATRITRYREKGGKFRTKSDLLKIYGVDSTFYERVYPFISLPERVAIKKKDAKKYEPKNVLTVKKAAEKFDLNNADTSELKKIYGIGDKLALRILKYREALGGFVDMNQFNEVYGLDSLVVTRLSENGTIQNDFRPKKININTASEKQLSSHPYLSKVAKAIVSYRFQHGNFKAVEDIRNVGSIDEKSIQRIIPYLKVNDEL